MKTCVSMECPFIHYCKEYNFLVDREGGCSAQKAILQGARKIERERRKEGRKNGKNI